MKRYGNHMPISNDYLDIEPPKRLLIDFIEVIQHKEKASQYKLGTHKHKFDEIIYIDFGEIQLKLENTKLNLHKGECIIIKHGESHSLHSWDGKDFNFLSIHFKGRHINNLYNHIFYISTNEVRILKKLREESMKKISYFEEILCLSMNELLYLLKRDRIVGKDAQMMKASTTAAFYSKIVQNSLEFLKQHYKEPYDPNIIADSVGISQSYLRSIIKQETGISLSQHLKKLRMEKALSLLEGSSKTVEGIAHEVGYTSTPHFYNVFKKEYGMTPKTCTYALELPEY